MSKRLISILLAILLLGGVAFCDSRGDRQSPGIGDILGQGKFPSDPHRIFRLVRFVPGSGNANSVGISDESLVIWDTNSDDGVTVTTTTTSHDSRVAGIIATDALTPDAANSAADDIGRRNWTWLQTYGLATARIAPSAEGLLTVGSSFSASSTACYISAFTQDTAGAYPTKWGIAGFAYDTPSAATTGTEVEVFLKGLD